MGSNEKERKESRGNWLKAGNETCTYRADISDSLQEQRECKGCANQDQSGHGHHRHEIPLDGVGPDANTEPQNDPANDEAISNNQLAAIVADEFDGDQGVESKTDRAGKTPVQGIGRDRQRVNFPVGCQNKGP